MTSRTELKVHRTGAKGRPTVVLLHGFLAASGYWIPVETELKNSFDVIALDLPGFGGSAEVPAPGSLEEVANCVMARLNELGVERFALLGFSMGGMVAQQIALDHPSRLSKLILYGTAAAGDLPDRFETWDASIARLEAQGVDSLTDKSVASWFVDGTEHPFYRVCRDAARGASQAACVTLMRAMQKWNVIDRLSEISVPTLVVVGDQDRSTKPSEAFRIWREVPNARLCVSPGCAHGVHMENPGLFNRVLIDFLIADA